MLGGAMQQIPAIKCAKELGFYVITCDYLPNNPGHKFADEYYNISTTEKERVLELAIKLGIDGVLAYASDPAAPTAAYVSEKMGLPGNPYDAVNVMTQKDLFRKFLKEHGFNTPQARGYCSYETAYKEIENLGIDIITCHTSGHSDEAARKMVLKELTYRYLIPIHTEQKEKFEKYKHHYILNDGEELEIR